MVCVSSLSSVGDDLEPFFKVTSSQFVKLDEIIVPSGQLEPFTEKMILFGRLVRTFFTGYGLRSLSNSSW